ncbi:MAG: hypothetical protein P1U78_13935 [Alcanivoracaceae bacterium]|nr:hypothetical protein [Alcanivoracaceae bacterium]
MFKAIWNGRVFISQSVFHGNVASPYDKKNSGLVMAPSGGAIFLLGKPSVHITESEFSDNIAKHGGAIATNGNPSIQLTRVKFRGNVAGMGGALAVVQASAQAHPAGLALQSCTFKRNLAGFDGGAVFVDGNTIVSISNGSSVVFRNNTALYGKACWL